jgi:hypothetical protein
LDKLGFRIKRVLSLTGNYIFFPQKYLTRCDRFWCFDKFTSLQTQTIS